MRSILSSVVNKGRLLGLDGASETATTTSSNTRQARSMTSRCPRVMGSNDPGYTAIRVTRPDRT